MANIAPYRLATGTVPCQANWTSARMASPVTQTPSTAVPLAVNVYITYIWTTFKYSRNMKTKILLFVTVVSLPIALKAQDLKDFSFFNNIKICYVVSSMAPGIGHFKRHDTLIPYGLGLETSLINIKRFSLDFGLQYRTTGNQGSDGIMFTDNGYSGPFHQENYQFYLDVPIHLSYEVFNYRFLKISILAGSRTTYQKSRYFTVTDHESTLTSDSWNTGYEFGITETFNVFKGLNLYASQSRNKYIGSKSFLRTIDLDFGLRLNLN
jgi:hypothetical protein